MKEQFQFLRTSLPPIIARHDIEQHTGGFLSKGYMQNLDSEGKGPRKIKIGLKVGYTREALVDWLISRSTD